MRNILFTLLLIISFIGYSQQPFVALIENSVTYQPTGTPQLSNFRVLESSKDTIRFDATTSIAGLTTTGFEVIGRTVSSIVIDSDGLGARLKVTPSFTFWEQSWIRLGSGDGTVNDFPPIPIQNLLDEPSTSTERWVTTSGNNGNAGTSEGAAWATIDYAMNNVSAGTIIHWKAGDYGDAPVTIAGSGDGGTVSAPIIVEGYVTTEGDLNDVSFYSYGDGAFNTADAPTLDGGNETDSGIDANNVEYIIIRNVQIENYLNGIDTGGATGSSYWKIENVHVNSSGAYGMNLNDGLNSTNNVGGFITVKNSTITNGRSVGIRIWGQGNNLDNLEVYADDTVPTDEYDYYISLYDCYESIVQNSRVERGAGVDHTGHGIGIKSDDTAWGEANTDNLIYNNDIYGIKGGVEFRHTEVVGNYSVGNRFYKVTGEESGGVHFRDDCSYNYSINDYFEGLNEGIRFYDQSTEQGSQPGGDNNKVINGLFVDCSIGIASQIASTTGTQTNLNNEFINCSFVNVTTLVSQNSTLPFDSTNTFDNCLFDTVTNRGGGSFTFANNLFYGGFTAEGTGQITTDPVLNGSYVPTATLTDIDVPTYTDIYYDRTDNLRNKTLTTVGAIKHANETP